MKCKRAFVTCAVELHIEGKIHRFEGNNGPSFGQECLNVEGGCGCIHAEARAIAKADAWVTREYLVSIDKINIDEVVVEVSTSPCLLCAYALAKAFFRAKSKILYYTVPYRLGAGLEHLTENGWDLYNE